MRIELPEDTPRRSEIEADAYEDELDARYPNRHAADRRPYVRDADGQPDLLATLERDRRTR